MKFDMLKAFMDSLVNQGIPGNSISLYYNNEEIFKYSAGFRSLEDKTPMDGSELLNIYSCSKIATVTAALQLYEQGIFLLSDPLYEYIPEFKDMYVKTADGERIKAKNPISHGKMNTYPDTQSFWKKLSNLLCFTVFSVFFIINYPPQVNEAEISQNTIFPPQNNLYITCFSPKSRLLSS